MRKDVTYYSDELKIAAHLYTPPDWKEGSTPIEVIEIVRELEEDIDL